MIRFGVLYEIRITERIGIIRVDINKYDAIISEISDDMVWNVCKSLICKFVNVSR